MPFNHFAVMAWALVAIAACAVIAVLGEFGPRVYRWLREGRR